MQGDGDHIPVWIHHDELWFPIIPQLKEVMVCYRLTFMKVSINFVWTILVVDTLMQREDSNLAPTISYTFIPWYVERMSTIPTVHWKPLPQAPEQPTALDKASDWDPIQGFITWLLCLGLEELGAQHLYCINACCRAAMVCGRPATEEKVTTGMSWPNPFIHMGSPL